jgi:hypothetical protein
MKKAAERIAGDSEIPSAIRRSPCEVARSSTPRDRQEHTDEAGV